MKSYCAGSRLGRVLKYTKLANIHMTARRRGGGHSAYCGLWGGVPKHIRRLPICRCHTASFQMQNLHHTAKKKVRVKCTLVQALRLCTGRAAHRESTGVSLLFLDHGTRRGWGVSVTPLPLFTPGNDSVPIVQEAGWTPGPVWTSAKNVTPIGILSPDLPARSQSLYRLSYPGPQKSGEVFRKWT